MQLGWVGVGLAERWSPIEGRDDRRPDLMIDLQEIRQTRIDAAPWLSSNVPSQINIARCVFNAIVSRRVSRK